MKHVVHSKLPKLPYVISTTLALAERVDAYLLFQAALEATRASVKAENRTVVWTAYTEENLPEMWMAFLDAIMVELAEIGLQGEHIKEEKLTKEDIKQMDTAVLYQALNDIWAELKNRDSNETRTK